MLVNDSNLFVPSNWYRLMEGLYIPRERKDIDSIVPNFPVNKEMPYSLEKMKIAIRNGMILRMKYKGGKEQKDAETERMIFPLLVGTDKNATPQLRAWHLKGFSVSAGGETERVWRMFRTDRIVSITFEGNFYRSIPDGYNKEDKHIINRYEVADLQTITRNQERLRSSRQVVDVQDVNVTLNKPNPEVRLQKTSTKLNLKNIFSNTYINQNRNQMETIKLLFIKGLESEEIYALFGVIGEQGKEVQMYSASGSKIEKGVILGSAMGKEATQIKEIEEQTEFTLYLATLE